MSFFVCDICLCFLNFKNYINLLFKNYFQFKVIVFLDVATWKELIFEKHLIIILNSAKVFVVVVIAAGD